MMGDDDDDNDGSNDKCYALISVLKSPTHGYIFRGQPPHPPISPSCSMAHSQFYLKIKRNARNEKPKTDADHRQRVGSLSLDFRASKYEGWNR